MGRSVSVRHRLPIVRRRNGRLLGGVCAGLAPLLGVEPAVVRVAFLLLSVAGGVGVAIYAIGWVALPSESPDGVESSTPSHGSAVDATAVLAVAVGAMVVLRSGGVWFSDALAIPVVLAAGGTGLVWGRRPGIRPARVAIGLSLIIVGAAAVAARGGSAHEIVRTAIAVAVVVVGIGLLLGPWLSRLTADLSTERRARIRSEERADLAAHLHDGVLQTLSLIQKRADDGREVRSLARRQERELRDWLWGAGANEGPTTIAGLLRVELASVEDRYGVRIETVTVGDAPLDEAGRALVLAGREAALNAARHAGVDLVDAYLEVEDARVSLFVRDRGRGFDPRRVPRDRRGLADSVRGRVRRVRGKAVVRSSPGEGTEVELSIPRTA